MPVQTAVVIFQINCIGLAKKLEIKPDENNIVYPNGDEGV